ncbi:type VII secretion-associated serine protease mycosin [Actinoplanes sp. KI2]|uniref:type VII secretion-associated serine protease mycosin n=1 Tax=Actinoplanes sp. KI2 TaxID=2983315 RepID=UPI0021D5DDAD|nr:type VII secretion-associated serine protease mycosin [Actinoplanes sp. KI2]MCU7722365.1 type VII secretion-associated serine protease mycosin [Actinoplanes sp. KI2]
MQRARRWCALLSAWRLASAALAGVVALVVPAAPAMADPVTADPLTTGPLTTGPLTADPLAAGPLTADPLATGPLTAVGKPLAEPVNPLVGDEVRGDEWYLRKLNIQGAWTYSTGAGVTVGVIDSGVDATHPDLQGQVLPGLDLVDPKGDGDTDLVGHGTTVSAIIAGRGDDSSGIIGMAPKAKILPVRVLDEENRYNDAIIVAKGVRWAVDHGARVINLSLGGNGFSATLSAALDYAFAKDVVVIACTGNTSASSDTDVWYPAREPGVIAVAGMEKDSNQLWSGSITGKETVVTAPATQLVGAQSGGGYWKVQGTSFAAPMVTGTAALIRSRWPTMPAGEVINRIIRTATDRGPTGRDATYGYGEINPTGALTASVPAIFENPLDDSPSPGVARFGSAPAPGQALSAPDETSLPAQHAAAGQAASPATIAPKPTGHAWLLAAGLLLISATAALLTVRRFTYTT